MGEQRRDFKSVSRTNCLAIILRKKCISNPIGNSKVSLFKHSDKIIVRGRILTYLYSAYTPTPIPKSEASIQGYIVVEELIETKHEEEIIGGVSVVEMMKMKSRRTTTKKETMASCLGLPYSGYGPLHRRKAQITNEQIRLNETHSSI